MRRLLHRQKCIQKNGKRFNSIRLAEMLIQRTRGVVDMTTHIEYDRETERGKQTEQDRRQNWMLADGAGGDRE